MPTDLELQDILDGLERGLSQEDSPFDQWSHRYLKHSKKRYISDFEFVKKYHHSGTLLEVGAVPCHFTYLLTKAGIDTVSVDLNPQRAKNFIDKQGLNVIACDIENESLPFQDDRFDTVVFYEVFEHLRINPIDTLRELTRVLKPGGYLLTQTPNLYSSTKLLRLIKGKGFDNPFKEFNKLKTIGHMGHTRIYTRLQVEEFLKKTGTKCVETKFFSHNEPQGKWRKLRSWLESRFPGLRSHFLVVSIKETLSK